MSNEMTLFLNSQQICSTQQKNCNQIKYNFLATAEAPKIISFPGNKVAAEGTTVTLKCEVKGSPKPLVVWRKGSEQLTGGRFTVLKTGDLRIDVSIHLIVEM